MLYIARLSMTTLLLNAFVGFTLLQMVAGALFITAPYNATTCHGGQQCTITWLDDGREPTLSDIGPSTFQLFHSVSTLVQQLSPATDVSSALSLTFTVDPQAGPNSNSYYIAVTSISGRDPNNTSQFYQSFSGNFGLDDMTGSAGSQVPKDTSSLPIPSQSVSITNGIVSTTVLPTPSSLSPISSASSPAASSTSPSSSRFSSIPSSSTGPSSSSSSSFSSSSATPTGSSNSGTVATLRVSPISSISSSLIALALSLFFL